MSEQGAMAAIPFWKHAVELDPNFALAYAALGTVYGNNLFEPTLAGDNLRKAYELRDRVSERERFEITADYYFVVTGELEKAAQTSELWAQAYPQDAVPHNGLGLLKEYLGQYERAAEEERKAIRLFQQAPTSYSNLMEDYVALDRLDEAKVTYHQAIDRKLDDPFLHDDMYAIAFLQGDVEDRGTSPGAFTAFIGTCVALPSEDYVDPAISPDGKRFAICIRRTAEQQLAVYDIDRGVLLRLSRFGTRNAAPAWTPDSKSAEVFDAEFDRGGAVSGYDVSPDGQRFLVTRSDQPNPTEVRFIINWPAYIEATK
jgi:hypothetical protein